MNAAERKIVAFRLISSFMILLNLGFTIFVMYYSITNISQNQTVNIVSCVFSSLLMIFEIIFILRGWKKESQIYKIAFNTNERINNVPLIAISVFFVFGLGLIILSTLLNVYKHFEPNISTSFSILNIAIYLVINCLIYYLYCLMYKKREVNLRSLIK